MTKKNTKESFESQFKDKIIVITGSTQGSGAETAKLLAMRSAIRYYNLWKKCKKGN
jgi:Dehydrogenases with different specificities (related to short-chain alcohol dehydrogenases)